MSMCFSFSSWCLLYRALEGVFRSVNNLLERLHHSEFFYYTASRMYFISIGLYMPPFGLLLAPVILEISSPLLTVPTRGREGRKGVLFFCPHCLHLYNVFMTGMV